MSSKSKFNDSHVWPSVAYLYILMGICLKHNDKIVSGWWVKRLWEGCWAHLKNKWKWAKPEKQKAEKTVLYLPVCCGETFMSRNGLISEREQARRSYSGGTVTEPGGRGVRTCLCVVSESVLRLPIQRILLKMKYLEASCVHLGCCQVRAKDHLIIYSSYFRLEVDNTVCLWAQHNTDCDENNNE